jgi:hypothetical protein
VLVDARPESRTLSAHGSQYEQLAANMRHALPNAAFIAAGCGEDS